MRNLYKCCVLAAVFLLLAAVAYASIYEWVVDDSVQLSGSFKANCAQSNKIYWTVETSDNYYEYRALYLSNNGTWRRITNCDRQGYLDGTRIDSCFNEPFFGFAPGIYTARVSINYAGCGTYTPTPASNCGDFEDINLILSSC